MKGIILAGGNGRRLEPLTKVTNKHLLAVYNKPMIYYPLQKIADAGVKDILIISGSEHADKFARLLGSGEEFGCKISYAIQREAGGIAQALALAEDFVCEENCMVILGDNIFEDNFSDAVKEFDSNVGARIFLKEVSDPQRFGVAELAAGGAENGARAAAENNASGGNTASGGAKDGGAGGVTASGGAVIGIEEKPKNPKTNWAVTGLYMYDSSVFKIIKTLKPSARGELEITDVNNEYIKNGLMKANFVKGEWTDAGTFESLFHANEIARRIVLQK